MAYGDASPLIPTPQPPPLAASSPSQTEGQFQGQEHQQTHRAEQERQSQAGDNKQVGNTVPMGFFGLPGPDEKVEGEEVGPASKKAARTLETNLDSSKRRKVRRRAILSAQNEQREIARGERYGDGLSAADEHVAAKRRTGECKPSDHGSYANCREYKFIVHGESTKYGLAVRP